MEDVCIWFILLSVFETKSRLSWLAPVEKSPASSIQNHYHHRGNDNFDI